MAAEDGGCNCRQTHVGAEERVPLEDRDEETSSDGRLTRRDCKMITWVRSGVSERIKRPEESAAVRFKVGCCEEALKNLRTTASNDGDESDSLFY